MRYRIVRAPSHEYKHNRDTGQCDDAIGSRWRIERKRYWWSAWEWVTEPIYSYGSPEAAMAVVDVLRSPPEEL